jgi:hypothetical protein
MNQGTKRKLTAAAIAGVAVAGAGGAIAATRLMSPKDQTQAIVNDAAKQLGIQPNALSDALKKAFENRIDAAVAAGTLTKEQGVELKKRIQSGELPLFGLGGGHFGHHGFGHHLDAAAKYLGLSNDELRTELEGGKTLAQVAKDHDKSVDGLIDALVADEKSELDSAVAAGRLTKEREQELLANAKQRFTDLVNGQRPEGRPFGFGERRSGPPPGFFSAEPL